MITDNKNKRKKGFTLLFAVLVSVLVLAVGASLVNLALKQIILSGSGRESQYAFYAAGTGIDCAVFWHIQNLEGTSGLVFATSSDSTLVHGQLGDDQVLCAGNAIITQVVSTPGLSNWNLDISARNEATTSFWIEYEDFNYCAYVTVRKYISAAGPITEINSYGYNTCDVDNPRRIERGLRAYLAS